MSSDVSSIRVDGLSKRYEIYPEAVDRLKQMILPKLRRWIHADERSYFHEFWALHDVSFNVRRGETIGIIGRNGSGKSTLLQLICGTLTPTVGHVSVRGRIAALLELGSGFNPEFTGRENVYLNATVLGLTRTEIDARFDDILAFADIGDFVDQPVKTYSSGMYVRLAFAVAIHVEPEILIVDEALSVGDEAFQRKCFARINEIRDAGATVLFVSHSVGAVIELCDRALLIDAGELLLDGLPKVVVGSYHRLLFAPADKQSEVRADIRRKGLKEAPGSNESPVVSAAPMAVEAPVDGEAYFEPGFTPKSTMRYENRGAFVEDPHIETLAGKRVNVLSRGQRYIYTYRVRFQSVATAIRFGMMIKTMTGIELGGAASIQQGTSELTVVDGEEYVVRFGFHTRLAPGVYFMNAGVTAFDAGEEIFLARILDAVMFRVRPDATRMETGLADFLSEVHIKRV